MANALIDEPVLRRPLRLWPGVVAVVLQWLAMYALPVVVPEAGGYGVIGGLVGGLVVVVWWAFFSRAPRSERWGAVFLMVVALAATPRILHVSIATGAMGMLFFILVIPVLSLAFVVWAVVTQRLADGPRRATMVATILLACAGWALVRTGGFTGAGDNDLAWRWAPTPEERLLASADAEPMAPLAVLPPAPSVVLPAPTAVLPAATPVHSATPSANPPSPTAVATPEVLPVPQGGGAPAALPVAPSVEELKKTTDDQAALLPALVATETGASWPGFRGPRRNGIISGVRIETDWSVSPPVEMWRRPIGPGWSSFAVSGDLLYTQEQRGDDEVVACYRVTTGEPVWRHRDATRFYESNGGAGPRATPTLFEGRLFTFGATGILNALDAHDGTVLWSHNAASDTGAKVPGWGFAGSPLVIDDVVIVHAGVLVAYDRASGERRWIGPSRGGGYSSPQLVTIDGVAQVVLMSGAGATSISPVDGSTLWEHPWPGTPIVQPALVAGGDLLISSADAMGGMATRRIAVTHGPGGWVVKELWASRGLKPYFNDFVVYGDYAFGFDGSILACLDLEDGARKWKGGRYGNGQLVLLADQNVLLVLSEDGELALVSATPDKFTELARFPAIEGKTWNHPVLVGDVLLVRNGEEMAAFRLSLAGSS